MKELVYTLIFILSISSWAEAQKRGEPAVNDKRYPAEKASVQGYVGRRLDQSYQNRILAQDVDHLIEPFKHRTESRLWQSEFWGK